MESESNSSQEICFSSEEKYKTFESLNQAISVIGKDGLLLYANSSFKKFFLNEDDTRLDLEHPFYPEYRKKIAKAYIGALNGITKYCFAVIQTKSNEKKAAEIHLFPMYENNEVVSILTMIKVVENRLLSFNDSTKYLMSDEDTIFEKNYYEKSPVPLLRINSLDEIIQCSQSFESYVGYSSEKILNSEELNFKFFFKKDYDRIKIALKSINNHETSIKRVKDIKVFTNNVTKFANLTIFQIYINNQISFNEIVLEDITHNVHLQEQISKINKVQLFRDISEGFIHTLNNNLNVILSNSQIIEQISEKEIVKDGIHQIKESADELVKQIHRIQKYINKNSSTNETIKEPIVKIIEDAVEFAKMQFKVNDSKLKKRISIEKKYFSGSIIETDTNLLREILISIILKVSKYIIKNGIIKIVVRENSNISIDIKVEKPQNEDFVHISPNTLNIFSGLKIRTAADKIGIKIIEEESSEFYSISAIIPNKNIVKNNETKSKKEKVKLKNLDIMVVEDEKPLQKILFELFDKMGNRVFITDNGKEALQEFKKNHYDIILTDYDIQGITGIELAARIKEINENIPTILLSGWSLGDLDSYENFIDQFFPKPFKLEDVITGMSSLLAEKKNPK